MASNNDDKLENKEVDYEFDFTTEDEKHEQICSAVEEGEERVDSSDDWIVDQASVDSMVEGLTSQQKRWVQQSTTVNIRWSGVRSCSKPERAGGAAQKALDAWVAKVLKDNAGWTLVSSGFPGFSYRYRNGRRSDGSRYCSGWANGIRLNAVFDVPS